MSKYKITLDGKTYEMEVELVDAVAPVTTRENESKEKIHPSRPDVQENSTKFSPVRQAESGSTVKSPMPGTVLRVNVSQGERVHQGQAILTLEAMKMENEISAPKDGKLISLFVKQGDSVQGGDVLFEIGE